MSMQSLQMLPELQELPATDDCRRSTRQSIEDLAGTDPAFQAAEFTASVSFAMWGIWDEVNVDDTLRLSYEAQYPGLATDHSLHAHWSLMKEQGLASEQGFVNGLKGKVAELDLAERLEQQGIQVTFPDSATHPGIDFWATFPDGTQLPVQVKSMAAENASHVESLMLDNPDTIYANSSELFDRIADNNPELVEQMVDIGSTAELGESVTEGLDLLSDNLGIDVPDNVGDIIPYAGAILAAARLIHGAIRTEQRFKAVDRTNRNKVQVVQALTLMSRMGITTVLATAGGMGGTAIGTAVPVIGNLVGGIAGTITGAGLGMYLNRHLQPHMLNLALDITGLTGDDLFYFKNKPDIDQTAWSLKRSADELSTGLVLAPAPSQA